jgi:hypothetical protein
LFTFIILIPSYTLLKESSFSSLLPESTSVFTSSLDFLTVADALTNPQLAFLLLILTFLYSVISFYAILVQFG